MAIAVLQLNMRTVEGLYTQIQIGADKSIADLVDQYIQYHPTPEGKQLSLVHAGRLIKLDDQIVNYNLIDWTMIHVVYR